MILLFLLFALAVGAVIAFVSIKIGIVLLLALIIAVIVIFTRPKAKMS